MNQDEARKLCHEYVKENGVPMIHKVATGPSGVMAHYMGPPEEIYDAFPPDGKWTTKPIDWVATWHFLANWKDKVKAEEDWMRCTAEGRALLEARDRIQRRMDDDSIMGKIADDDGYGAGAIVLGTIFKILVLPIGIAQIVKGIVTEIEKRKSECSKY